MHMTDKDKFELEKRTEDPLNCNSPSLSSEWRFTGSILPNTSMSMVSPGNQATICKGNLIGSDSSSLWEHPSNIQTLGLYNSSILKGGIFLPNNISSLIPPNSLSQFPADSAFIERAARFSCFSGGNISDMVNPFGVSESMSAYSRGGALIQGTHGSLSVNESKSKSSGQTKKSEMNMGEDTRGVRCGHSEARPLMNEMKRSDSFMRAQDELKHGINVSSNESDEAEVSGGNGEEDCSEPNSSKGIGLKKRKRTDQVNESNQLDGEAEKDKVQIQQSEDLKSTKPSGKHGKQSSQASDSQKEDYIHVRARRGQATNSHSLAERVRREKISERMKFLQDLVPGCSKVTGKAVMLDEIINYVQSLQRQVEFLSMKLATVNPRLDFNIEGLLAKDALQSRAGPSSTMGFSSDMARGYSPIHPSQAGMIQPGLGALANTSDLLRRTINSQLTTLTGGYKEANFQLPNVWEDELHNIVKMGFGTSATLEGQDLGPLPPGHMKVEL